MACVPGAQTGDTQARHGKEFTKPFSTEENVTMSSDPKEKDNERLIVANAMLTDATNV